MMWRLIHKNKSHQPDGDDYTAWKEQIARECFHHCVYCAIHEDPWGGIDHYHIDHYRPRSIEAFKQFELDICNLFYACPVCNRFKSNDWPAEPDEQLDICCYPDPSKVNYADIFALDPETFKISGKNKAARYVIERLYLNRPQLIFERREHYLNEQEMCVRKQILPLILETDDQFLMVRYLTMIDKLVDHLHSRKTIRPYQLQDIRKKDAKN